MIVLVVEQRVQKTEYSFGKYFVCMRVLLILSCPDLVCWFLLLPCSRDRADVVAVTVHLRLDSEGPHGRLHPCVEVAQHVLGDWALAVLCFWAPKWPTGSGKGSNPRLLGAPVNFCKISFLIRAILLWENVAMKKKWRKNGNDNGGNSSPLGSLPVERLKGDQL